MSKRRTKFDKNEIVEYEDYAEVILYNKDNEEIARAKFDLDDIDIVKTMKWHLASQGYARSWQRDGVVYLHRLIMNCESDFDVDHINRDRLDNRKFNLRIVTRGQNLYNSSMTKKNTSGFIGVSYSKDGNKWVGQLKYNGKNMSKRFNNKEDAIKHRLQLEKDYFGEFAPQKHLFKEYGIEL